MMKRIAFEKVSLGQISMTGQNGALHVITRVVYMKPTAARGDIKEPRALSGEALAEFTPHVAPKVFVEASDAECEVARMRHRKQCNEFAS
jgi:hypothetical protein